MSEITLTYAQFAHDIGKHSRLTRKVSLVWHKQFVRGSVATRHAMREEFMQAFIAGYCKDVRNLTTEIKREAEMAASQKFKYHISRDGVKDQPKPEPKPEPKAEPKHMRVSKAMRNTAMDFLGNFEGESLDEQIQQAIALLNAML